MKIAVAPSCRSCSKPLKVSGVNYFYSVTAGIAQLASDQKTTDFYKEAENNQLRAHNLGKNMYVASFAA